MVLLGHNELTDSCFISPSQYIQAVNYSVVIIQQKLNMTNCSNKSSHKFCLTFPPAPCSIHVSYYDQWPIFLPIHSPDNISLVILSHGPYTTNIILWSMTNYHLPSPPTDKFCYTFPTNPIQHIWIYHYDQWPTVLPSPPTDKFCYTFPTNPIQHIWIYHYDQWPTVLPSPPTDKFCYTFPTNPIQHIWIYHYDQWPTVLPSLPTDNISSVLLSHWPHTTYIDHIMINDQLFYQVLPQINSISLFHQSHTTHMNLSSYEQWSTVLLSPPTCDIINSVLLSHQSHATCILSYQSTVIQSPPTDKLCLTLPPTPCNIQLSYNDQHFHQSLCPNHFYHTNINITCQY